MRYAIIGLGPVGQRLGVRAKEAGHDVVGFDLDRAISAPIPRTGALTAAVQGADRVVSAVPAAAAERVLDACMPALAPNATFEDWSSAAPERKRSMSLAGGPAYVDVTLLDSITASEPMVCVAGEMAADVAAELESFGFTALVAGRSPGGAARVKMVRSAFMKPLEVLAIELLRTSAEWDPEGVALRSVSRTLGCDFRQVAEMLIETNRLHAMRRSQELSQVIGSVALDSGRDVLEACREYLEEMNRTWSRPEAPREGSSSTELLAYLSGTAVRS